MVVNHLWLLRGLGLGPLQQQPVSSRYEFMFSVNNAICVFSARDTCRQPFGHFIGESIEKVWFLYKDCVELGCI